MILTKPTKLPVPPERHEQRAIVKWLNYHPIVRNFFCKLNNEGKRTIQQGFNLKLEGLRPGAFDIFIYYPTKSHPGLWLEIKRNKKYSQSEMQTPTWIAQLLFQKTVKSVGYQAHFCYGWEDATKIIDAYLLT